MAYLLDKIRHIHPLRGLNIVALLILSVDKLCEITLGRPDYLGLQDPAGLAMVSN